ncbi:MAG: addiction module protein [Myxococcota bacterium]|nr:addiction module protein [Myxococcota bacterium]
MANKDEILSSALRLSSPDRAELAQELLRSLDADQDSGVEAAWDIELERRAREVSEGSASTHDARDVLKELSARLKARTGG